MRVITGRTSRRSGHNHAYTPTQTVDGYTLQSSNDGPVGLVVFGVFSVVWLVVTVGLGAIGWATGEWIPKVMAVFFGLFLLPLLLGLKSSWSVLQGWNEGTLHLAEWPMMIGGTQTAWFSRTSKRTGDLPSLVTGQLILRESATYQVGTDTRTATEDVTTIDLELIPAERSGVAGFEFELTIPGDGPSTIELGRNLVEWLVEFTVDDPDAPETTSLFLIRVLPEVAT